MKYLGIDYGKERIGIAVSDDNGQIAFPLQTIPGKNPFALITDIAQKEKVNKIVLGLPVPFSGDASKQTIEIKKIAAKLKKTTGLEVEFENEALTTKLAKKEGIPEKHLDKAAAAIILQSYLDKKNRK
ncbi:MAG: Holliday junction resolvase RuvX [Candidatus Sungbacteria bacterium]|nr:Holliday junction resolvase RuvX [Candidatus Sungbacteria bacterium]